MNDAKSVTWIRDIQSKFKNVQSQHLHFADLLPFKKLIACKALAANPCRMFVVMSNKKNIRQYRNPNLDPRNKAWIYWWLARLLLERVTSLCERVVPVDERGKQKLRIIFSRRGDLKYDAFRDYLRKLAAQSRYGELTLGSGDIKWSLIDFDEIFALDHVNRAGLQLADIGAGAFFQAVERTRPVPVDCDPSYATALNPIMARDQYGRVLGFGIKTMPDLLSMTLTDDQKKVFEAFGQKNWQAPGS